MTVSINVCRVEHQQNITKMKMNIVGSDMTFTKNFIKKKNRNIIEDGFKKENTSCWKNICVVVANITHFNTKKDTRNHKSTKTG